MGTVNRFEPLVTCIVPVYNAEKYLKECVDSLLGQSYKNLEILLVDDHSTDSSWKICQNYAAKHENIRAIRTERNSGSPLEGRRLGVKKAKGDWITFMDNDDFVKKNYIKHLVEGTDHGKYDISVTGHSRLHEDGAIVDFVWESYTRTTNERLNEFYAHFIQGDYHTDPTDTIGQNLVRAEIAKAVDLDVLSNNVYAEDTLMALSFLANSKNGINFVDHHDFIWRQVSGSGSHGGFYKRADRDAFYDACNTIFTRPDIRKVLDPNIGKVSVIVPIYNVEKHLAKCVDSILSQTYANIEVILVDDKTPDSSGKIADDYAQKDKRVKVIHKPKNEGLNMARAAGYSASTGTHVMFVDSDDLIARDCVEFALRAKVKNKAEFAKFNSLTFSDENELPKQLASVDQTGEERVIAGREDLYTSRFTNRTVGISRVTVWGGLYPRDMVEKIDWTKSNYRQHEDVYWTMQLLEHATKGVFMSRVGYFYRVDTTNKNVLSKSLSGNTFNGKPIGHLEFAHDYSKKLKNYSKKYGAELNEEIDKFISWQWIDGLSTLSKADMLSAENNAEYLPEAINAMTDHYLETRKVIAQQAKNIAGLQVENKTMQGEIDKLRNENRHLKDEIRSHMSIKRSARLLLGNIKRKIKPVVK
jgi:glycosyltransferase involved in cell wall biosynthesis